MTGSKWNFLHAVVAIDGKHVRIIKPEGSGSDYFNYKKFFSVLLFAAVIANFEYFYIHSGINGRISDSTVMRHSNFHSMLTQKELNLPASEMLPNSAREAPFVFLGDAAFPLSSEIMKLYPHERATLHQKIYNHRLSRTRRVVENAFGILASRFTFYETALQMSVDYVLLASCVLHNYLTRNSNGYLSNQSLIRENIDHRVVEPGEYSDVLIPFQNRPQQPDADGREVCETFKEYFLNEGRVNFQDHMVNSFQG